MITLLYGPNSFAITQKLRELSTKFITAHGQDAIEKYDGEQLTPTQLPDLLQGATLFASDKFVVIRGAAQNKSLWEALESWVEKPTDGIEVVLIESNPDKRTKTFKTLQKHAEVNFFDELNPAQLSKWVTTEANDNKVELSTKLVQLLIDRVGSNQWQLSSELKKLSNAPPPITAETIENLIEASPQASVFDLLDAAFRLQTSKVKSLLKDLETNEDPYRFFGLLTAQVFALCIAAAGKDKPSGEVAVAAGIHPFVLKKLAPIASKMTKTDISRIADIVATADDQMKSTGAEPWLILEQALMKIATR